MKSARQTKCHFRQGDIRVLHHLKTGVTTYMLRGGHQTAVDRHGVSLDMYIHTLYSLILQSGARDILMIGCGGGTLATMLHRAGLKITVVDIDKGAFEMARRHFHLPRDIKCYVADGLVHMQKTRKRYDVLVADAFVGERIPKHMTGEAFFLAARKCVRPEGAVFANVCLSTRKDQIADRFARGFKEHGWPVRMLDRPRIPARNAVILAGAVKGLRRPKLIVRPETAARQIDYELSRMRFRNLLPPAR